MNTRQTASLEAIRRRMAGVIYRMLLLRLGVRKWYD